MPIYYFDNKVAAADSLKVAKQVFEKISNRKLDITEILDYDPIFLNHLEKVNEGFLIQLKDGSYIVNFSWNKKGYKVFSTFDKTKAKVFTKAKKAVNIVEDLFWYNYNQTQRLLFPSAVKIFVDDVEIFPNILI